MLQNHVANLIVIIGETDKIPNNILTTKGTRPLGAFKALKSVIEPTTARKWASRCHRLPLNLMGVNWVMTTNSTATLPPSATAAR